MTDNLLLKALPPETDYLSYLTILEYNLTHEQLPTLHEILQDTSLTSNIGWDLVHLLLPLLPDSRLCLQDIARLGNPREVVLKVTEFLEHLGAASEDVEEAEDKEVGAESEYGNAVGEASKETLADRRAPELQKDHREEKNESSTSGQGLAFSKVQSKVVKFTNLISMLQTLHPRIRTKYPSRFLSTSLQAILPAYASIANEPEATEAIVAFIKALSGTSRPKLPPRMSSLAVLTHIDKESEPAPELAPDPEGNDGSIGPNEKDLQKRLLQSFLTHVVEGYIESLPSVEDVPGMAWSSRLQEKLHPEKMIPGRRTCTDLFAHSNLHGRDTVTGQLAALARDLKLTPEETLAIIIKPDDDPSSPPHDLPSSASDVPLSHHGSLYLLSASIAASTLFNAPASLPSMAIFPHFSTLLPFFIGVASPSTAGSEPASLIDAMLFLGTYILSNSSIGTFENDEVFNETLQRLSLLSANTPIPSLRYHAHVLTAEILHSHPKEEVRLAYIKDTLKHCPYENLKASAVGWLKTELLASSETVDIETQGKLPALFATDVALSAVSPDLFANPKDSKTSSTEETLTAFSNNQPFWMAVLNLVYLIRSSRTLFGLLSERFVSDATSFTIALSEAAASVREDIAATPGAEDVERDVVLLEGLLGMVRGKLGK